jgi:hypothetical protein
MIERRLAVSAANPSNVATLLGFAALTTSRRLQRCTKEVLSNGK